MTVHAWTPPIVAPTSGKTDRGVRLTPPALYREIERRFGGGGFDIDAASSAAYALAPHYFSAAHSGLDRPWRVDQARTVGSDRGAISGAARPHGRARVFCNPPYSEITEWIQKAIAEMRAEHCDRVVFLIPARTSTAWFEAAIAAGARAVFPRGRVRFLGADRVPLARPFEHSVILIFERTFYAREFRGGNDG